MYCSENKKMTIGQSCYR